MEKLLRYIFVFQFLVLQASMAEAYIGPGTAASAIMTMLGVVGSFLLAIFAIVWYPIKRALKARRKPTSADDGAQPNK
ncbi:MAG: hypothetical protein U1E64_03930 [Sphingomonadaceae bacterium]|jgi:hypothetical protein